MTSERARAYSRVMVLVDTLGDEPLPEERDQIRDAADLLAGQVADRRLLDLVAR